MWSGGFLAACSSRATGLGMELVCKFGTPLQARSDHNSARVAGVASRLIRKTGVKEVLRARRPALPTSTCTRSDP
eukprot:1159236-Pelagomonas_calceolata.AAC.6